MAKVIKAKYPDTYRWYMHDKTQGYGSGTGQNSGTTVNEDTAQSIVENATGDFNSLNQSSGTTTNENQERTVPFVQTFDIELWGIVNGGGNRDSGNNVNYLDENGDSQSLYVLNGGASSSFLSSQEYPIATVTGDPYELRRLAVGQDAIDALGYPFTTQNQFDAAFAAGESEATVQAEYDAQ